MMKTHIYTFAAVGLLACAGCDKGMDSSSTPAPAPAPPGGVSVSAPAPAAPAPPGAPVAPTAPAELSVTVPMEPLSAGTEKIIASLEVAAEYYNRAIVTQVAADEEQAKNWKQPPPLTDLQQLVTYKVIRAVPAGPDGKKFIYDTKDGKVKLQ